ncbi:MAG: DNA/RNA non-specific endonuclease, partial [Oscillospiraceae bacterium]
ATVFSGPVFADDDRLYRGIRIPKAFWKVVAYLSDDGKPSAKRKCQKQCGYQKRGTSMNFQIRHLRTVYVAAAKSMASLPL